MGYRTGHKTNHKTFSNRDHKAVHKPNHKASDKTSRAADHKTVYKTEHTTNDKTVYKISHKFVYVQSWKSSKRMLRYMSRYETKLRGFDTGLDMKLNCGLCFLKEVFSQTTCARK